MNPTTKWKSRRRIHAAEQETRETQVMTQDTTSIATEKHPTEPADTSAVAAAAPSITSTKPVKYRYRYVFTAIRRYEKRLTLGEVVAKYHEDIMDAPALHLRDDNTWDGEKVAVRLEIWDKPNKRWLPVNT